MQAIYGAVTLLLALLATARGGGDEGAPVEEALFVTLDDTFFFTDWVTSTATPAIPTMAEYFWSDPEAALNVSACASACATAYESCGFFRLALAETVIGSCKLYPLETNASIVVHARTDPSPGRELVHWGYVTSRAPLLPLTTDSDHLDLEEELDYEAADLFSFAPAPNPLDETSPSSRTEGCTLLEYTLKSALLDTPKPGLTLSHCLKCGWVAIDEMPYEVYCRIAGQVMALGMRRGESGWMDSIWGCLEPEPGFNAPFGVPVPARCAGKLPEWPFDTCSCPKGYFQNDDVFSLLTGSPWCLSSMELYGCPESALANTTHGCTACPVGYQPMYSNPHHDTVTNVHYLTRCLSCTNEPGPFQLHCLSAEHCQPPGSTTPASATRSTAGTAASLAISPSRSAALPPLSASDHWPSCTACEAGHVKVDDITGPRCLPCTTLGCAEGACQEATGCTSCQEGDFMVQDGTWTVCLSCEVLGCPPGKCDQQLGCTECLGGDSPMESLLQSSQQGTPWTCVQGGLR